MPKQFKQIFMLSFRALAQSSVRVHLVSTAKVGLFSRRFMSDTSETRKSEEIPTLTNGPKLPLWNAITGCKDALLNRYKAWQLTRQAKTRKLTGPEMRFIAYAKQDFLRLQPIALIFILPIIGYIAPIYYLFAPHRAPSTCLTPEMKAHEMKVRAHARATTGAALRRFLYQISDDYARRPQPPIVFFKIYKPEFAHKNPNPESHTQPLVQTTDAKAPTSMLQELAEQKRTRAMEQSLSAEEIYVATAGAQHIRGVGSSVLLPGSGHIDMEAYFKRPKRSLMQILEEDRKLYAKYSGEMQEALLAMRVRDYQLYGDNPLMWDRAKQFRAIEAARKQGNLKPSDALPAEFFYTTKIPIRLLDGDRPLTVEQMHKVTPFFHYYITRFMYRANPLPVLEKLLSLWGVRRPSGGVFSDALSNRDRLAIFTDLMERIRFNQEIDESYRVQGVENLTHDELVEANYQRCMKWDLPDSLLRQQLQSYLDYHSTGEMHVPGTMQFYGPLLLSPEQLTPEAQKVADEFMKEALKIDINK